MSVGEDGHQATARGQPAAVGLWWCCRSLPRSANPRWFGVCERIPNLHFSVSATTRAPRPGEVDGVDYRFIGPPLSAAHRPG